jgi:hypothetical protein
MKTIIPTTKSKLPTEKKFGKTAAFLNSGSQTIYAYLEYRQKPRYSAVFTTLINDLTTAVYITGESEV